MRVTLNRAGGRRARRRRRVWQELGHLDVGQVTGDERVLRHDPFDLAAAFAASEDDAAVARNLASPGDEHARFAMLLQEPDVRPHRAIDSAERLHVVQRDDKPAHRRPGS
jgi:hypothetical protein